MFVSSAPPGQGREKGVPSPRVALRPADAGLRFTRGYSQPPLRGVERCGRGVSSEKIGPGAAKNAAQAHENAIWTLENGAKSFKNAPQSKGNGAHSIENAPQAKENAPPSKDSRAPSKGFVVSSKGFVVSSKDSRAPSRGNEAPASENGPPVAAGVALTPPYRTTRSGTREIPQAAFPARSAIAITSTDGLDIGRSRRTSSVAITPRS